jgi:hypothetical protein
MRRPVRRGAGQLGAGRVAVSATVPVALAAAARFTSIHMTGHRTCAITADGRVHCRGLADGLGLAGDVLVPCGLNGARRCAASPARITGLPAVHAVTVGAWHACAIAAGGRTERRGRLHLRPRRRRPRILLGQRQLRSARRAAPPRTRRPALRRLRSLHASARRGRRPTPLRRAQHGRQPRLRHHPRGASAVLGQRWPPTARPGGRCARPLRLLRPRAVQPHAAGEDATCAITAAGHAYCWGRATAGGVESGIDGSPVRIDVPTDTRLPRGDRS